MQDENYPREYQGAALASFPGHPCPHPERSAKAERSAVVLGSVGTAVSLALGPAVTFFYSAATREWFWAMIIGPLMYGAVGVALGWISLSVIRGRIPSGKLTAARVLGIVSIIGGGAGLTIFGFFLMILGTMVAASHY